MQFGRVPKAALGSGAFCVMPLKGAMCRALACVVGLLALVVPAEAGAHSSDGKHGSDAEVRMQKLRDNVQKAMLELYMENADIHLDERLSLIAGKTAKARPPRTRSRCPSGSSSPSGVRI